MKKGTYLYGIPEDGLKANLESWLENPFWREYYEEAPSDICRTIISLEYWESEYRTGAAHCAIKNLEDDLSVEDWRHMYRYCGNNPMKKIIHDRIMDLELKDQFDLLTDIRIHPDHYYPLIDHAEWHHEGRTETGDTNIGWNIGLLEENRPWFGECWATEGITMLTYFFSTRNIEEKTPEQLGLMLEEAGIVRFNDTEHDNTPAVQKITDGKGNEFFSVNITVGVEDEVYITGDSGNVHDFRELNRFNETVFQKKKEMLEKLIGEVGKETESTRILTPEEKTALGNEYNNRGWELQNGAEPDLKGADAWYRKAAKLGNTTAMVNLGNIYEEQGELRKAYEWYMDAAHAGNDTGRFNMARMFFHGEGVNQDYEMAYRFFEELYEKDYPGVNLYMGLYAENGFLANPDYEAAVKYYEQGIEEGDEYCPTNLGRMYCKGIGVPEDLKKGFELYMLGWERGDALAATNIGYCYEVGQGVQKNREKAVEYYTYAAERGEENAIEALERLEEEL